MSVSNSTSVVVPRLATLTLSQQIDYRFSEQTLEREFPGMTKKITDAITSLAGTKLESDLQISMPRLEAVNLSSADFTIPASAVEDDIEETLAQQCKSYLALLNRFNNYVGQGIEELIGTQLNGLLRHHWTDNSSFVFIRNAVQFPDLYLIHREEKRILLSVEIKSWFVFSSDDITARFEAAPNIIKEGSLLVLFPWHMTDLVFGTPILLEPYIGDAKALAERRDNIWMAGGLNGFKKGIASPNRKIEVPVVDAMKPTALNQTKTKSVAYQRKGEVFEKESENFGKIWRIYDEHINNVFYSKTLENDLLDKKITKWRKLLGIDT
jgi:hypothetical protein